MWKATFKDMGLEKHGCLFDLWVSGLDLVLQLSSIHLKIGAALQYQPQPMDNSSAVSVEKQPIFVGMINYASEMVTAVSLVYNLVITKP